MFMSKAVVGDTTYYIDDDNKYHVSSPTTQGAILPAPLLGKEVDDEVRELRKMFGGAMFKPC